MKFNRKVDGVWWWGLGRTLRLQLDLTFKFGINVSKQRTKGHASDLFSPNPLSWSVLSHFCRWWVQNACLNTYIPVCWCWRLYYHLSLTINNLLLRTDFRLGLYSLPFLSVYFADPRTLIPLFVLKCTSTHVDTTFARVYNNLSVANLSTN